MQNEATSTHATLASLRHGSVSMQASPTSRLSLSRRMGRSIFPEYRSRSHAGMYQDGSAAGLQRSVSEPLFAGSPTPGDSQPCFVSPSGLTSPSLRATSLLHQRHQADMARFGRRLPAHRPPEQDEDSDEEICVGRRQDSWDLRRMAGNRQTAAQQEDVSRNMGRLAKLVHVRHSGNPSMPDETCFAMPHPFHGHAPRTQVGQSIPLPQPTQGRVPHILKPLSAKKRRSTTHSRRQGPTLQLESWAQLGQLPGSPLIGSNTVRDSGTCSDQRQEQASGIQEPPGEEMASISVVGLYNSVVDGLAGHLIVDTRSADDYDQSHIWGAIDLEEALTFRGKHILLVSQSGIVGPVESNAVAALNATQGVLSLRNVEGGMRAWAQAYPFMCERTAASLDEEHQQRRERARHIYPSQVLPWLYISGIEAAQDHKVLRDIGVTHVLSILADPDKARVPKFCARLKLPMRDEVEADISAVFDAAWDFVREARAADGGRLLIHCKMGRSRSACILLMALLRSGEFSLRTGWRHLRACRRQIAVNAGFVKQLIAEEEKLTGRHASVRWDNARQQLILD